VPRRNCAELLLPRRLSDRPLGVLRLRRAGSGIATCHYKFGERRRAVALSRVSADQAVSELSRWNAEADGVHSSIGLDHRLTAKADGTTCSKDIGLVGHLVNGAAAAIDEDDGVASVTSCIGSSGATCATLASSRSTDSANAASDRRSRGPATG
jgi:hypothetical protein